MTKEIIFTDKAPKAIGPYSQAVKSNGFLFVSGQIPLNPETGDLMNASIEDQAEQVIQNLKNVCEAANTSLSDIVKLTIYITDMNDFSIVNEAMAKHFSEPYPARATVEVSALPLGVNVEMDAIVLTND
ncbi:MAG: RidA family protein [Gammaproteobacteria bacterium]|nr:reactive intermediate/imine deaminase [Gammaproteobacteria bacterium]|tara:strand:+ start:39 stop:425 length:387 start_codon:yes stop_codon:yes gene_type:complete